MGPKVSGASYGPGPDRSAGVADEAAANVVEISGVIKWFDVSKGFGFIVPDNGMPDVLLHVTCLRRDGFQTAYEGARVVCEVLQRPKGLQAFRVLSMDESTAIHPAQMPPARTHVTVTPTSGLERAMVKWFNRLRGFGFLDSRRGNAGHFRPYGDLAPLRDHRAATGPDRAGALWARTQRDDGCRSAAGWRTARTRLALRLARCSSLVYRVRVTRRRLIVVAAFVMLGAARRRRAAVRPDPPLEIVSKSGVHVFTVELAANDAIAPQGLMFRKELPEGQGMLFDFQREQDVSMWMRNTPHSARHDLHQRRRAHPADRGKY